MATTDVRGLPNDIVAVEGILGTSSKLQLVSDVKGLKRALRRLSQVIADALSGVREERDEEIDHRYSWDWEMIRELIEFEHHTAFFAAALMIALRSSMRQDAKILVLEGAKREASFYLRRLLRDAQRRKRTGAESSKEGKELRAGVFRHSSWRTDLSPIAALKPRHPEVDVLEWFLANRAVATQDYLSREEIEARVPSMGGRDESNARGARGSFALYLESLSGSRGGGIRNQSDAANLALLTAINDKNEGKRWRLVTGTKVLRKMRPAETISPISFAVNVALKDQLPSAEDRENYLNQCNGRISEIIDELDVNERAMGSAAPDITRQDIARIGNSLDILQSDPILKRLLRIVANASMSAQNEFALVKQEISMRAVQVLIAPEGEVSEFRALSSTVERIYKQLYENGEITAVQLGVEWDSQPTEIGLAKQWRLCDQRSTQTILTLDVYGDCYVVCWSTRVSVGKFALAVSKMLDAAEVEASQCRVVFWDSPSIDVPVRGKFKLEAILQSIRDIGRIARITVITKLGDFYYGVPGTDRRAFERVFLEGDTDAEFGFESGAETAIVSNHADLRVFETLYAATYLDYLPSGFFSSEVERKLSDTGWEHKLEYGNG